MKKTLLILVWIASLLFPVSLAAATSNQPMNVIFILADDLGWSDTTLYGTTELYQTPNIERLSKRGMTFSRAYANSPLCSPTRASVLTGQSPARHGSTRPIHHLKAERVEASPGWRAPPSEKAIGVNTATRLDTKLPTLGKQFRKAGYTTAHFGKWHLGSEPYSPLEHGFDVDIPHHAGPGPAGSFIAPWTYPNFKASFPGEHIEDRMAKEAVAWMNSIQIEKPFYVNYWQFSVHAPFDAKPELIERYRRQIDPTSPQRCPTYAAMVHSLDNAVGVLLDAVDQTGIADRTVIVFISDNGGNMYDEVEGETPTSNFPLRGGKATIYEGGIRVPCIVVWPGVTEPGSRSDGIIQTSDFYPTLLNGLGVALPGNHAIDGIDIMPALKGGKLDRDAIFTYFPFAPPIPDWLPLSMSVHSGDWKLIRLFHEGENGAHDYRLYNLAEDIGEENNLTALYPEKVQLLDRMIENYLAESGAVVPRPNPEFDPNLYQPENVGLAESQWKTPRKTYGFNSGQADDQQYATLGFRGNPYAEVKVLDHEIFVQCTGDDPQILLSGIPAATGPYTLELTLKSTRNGTGMVFWSAADQPAFSGEWKSTFALKHEGHQWREYTVALPAVTPALTHLRFDPGESPGQVRIARIVLKDASGKVIKSWMGQPDTATKPSLAPPPTHPVISRP